METLENKREKNSAEVWRRHIKGWEASGLSRAMYCRQNSLNRDTFRKWKIKLSEGVPRKQKIKSNFIQLPSLGMRKIPLIEFTMDEKGHCSLRFSFDVTCAKREGWGSK